MGNIRKNGSRKAENRLPRPSYAAMAWLLISGTTHRLRDTSVMSSHRARDRAGIRIVGVRRRPDARKLGPFYDVTGAVCISDTDAHRCVVRRRDGPGVEITGR